MTTQDHRTVMQQALDALMQLSTPYEERAKVIADLRQALGAPVTTEAPEGMPDSARTLLQEALTAFDTQNPAHQPHLWIERVRAELHPKTSQYVPPPAAAPHDCAWVPLVPGPGTRCTVCGDVTPF